MQLHILLLMSTNLLTHMQQRLSSYTKQVVIADKIVELLATGSTIPQVAGAVDRSRQYVRKVAQKAVKDGLLKRSGKYPVMYYAKKQRCKPPTMPSGQYTPPNNKKIVLPHRFGVKFLLKRKPKQLNGYWKRTTVNKWDLYTHKAGDYTIVLYPSKVIIWIFNFDGKNVDQCIKQGTQQAAEVAQQFMRESGAELCDGQLMHPVEWVIHNKELSNYVRNILKLDIAPVDMAGSRFKLDVSHPEQVEIDKDNATDTVKTMEWLITQSPNQLTQLAKTQYDLLEQVQQLATSVNDLAYLINQKQNL